jgi:chromosome segregation ATPase
MTQGVNVMNESPSSTGPNYKREFEKERQRLAQLWDAYEDQEKEVNHLKDQVDTLKMTLDEKERIIRSLKEVLQTRDTENRELHIELTALRSERTTWDPKLKDLEQKLRLQKDSFGKLYKLAEELDLELKEARSQIEARDRWYKKNILVMGNIKRAMEDREEMIESATSRSYEPVLEGELGKLKPID